jgi:hypothetical protein
MTLYYAYVSLIGVFGLAVNGILWADFLIPIIFYKIFLDYRLIPKKILITGLLLIFYTVIIALLSVLFGSNNYFYAAALTLRSASFILLIFYGIILVKSHGWEENFQLPIYLVLLASLLITLLNFSLGQRAYYGYAQIMPISAPAISGFLLGILTLFLIIRVVSRGSYDKYIFILIGIVLTFLTFSISANISLIGSVLVLFFLILFLPNNYTYKVRVKILSILSTFMFFLFMNLDGILEIFSRITRVFQKIEYRLSKSEGTHDILCSDFSYCTIFGVGPGMHSTLNDIAWGEGSIISFDQLYGRLLLEWGWAGFLLWVLFIVSIVFISNKSNKVIISFSTVAMIAYGVSFGIGSEFIFVSFSGSMYAILLGIVAGKSLK